MQLSFLRLSGPQLVAFLRLESHQEAAHHGPLEAGQEVPTHRHDQPALYLVNGRAQFRDGSAADGPILGQDEALDAVVVPANQSHGWLAVGQSVIAHVFGEANVKAVMLAA